METVNPFPKSCMAILVPKARFGVLCWLILSALSSEAQDRTVPEEEFLSGGAFRVTVHADSGSFVNGVYPIDGIGMAELPVIGKILVAGKKRVDVEQYLSHAWTPYLRDTHVTAVPVIRVGILGNVKSPGYFYVNPDAVVFDLMAMAGGPQFPGNVESTSLVRGGSTINGGFLREIGQGKTLREARVRSGDHIHVPMPPLAEPRWQFAKDIVYLTAGMLGIVAQTFTIYYLANRD